MATTSFKKNFIIDKSEVKKLEKILSRKKTHSYVNKDIKNVKMDSRRMNNILKNFKG